MTYWPISAPTAYAASKQQLSNDETSTSHDGLKEAEATTTSSNGRSIAIPEEPSDTEESASDVSNTGREDAPAMEKEAPTHHRHVPEAKAAVADNDIAGHILGLRVTRNGHIFATITDTTLTIWQTKARNLSDEGKKRANNDHSQRPYWRLS